MLRGVSACSEVMKSMRPLVPPFFMRRPSSRAMKNPERTLVLTIPSHVASETVSAVSVSRRAGEAECTSRWIGWPMAGSAVRQPSVVERSTITDSAAPPALTISSTTAALRAASMSTQRTRRTLARQRQRDRPADVGGRAGDERALALEEADGCHDLGSRF